MIEKGAEAFGKLIAENANAQIEVAKINLPVTQKAQEMQEDLNKRHWDHVDAERNARVSNDNKAYAFAFFVVAIVFAFAAVFLYLNDRSNAMAIISGVLGFIAGFLSGQGWARLRQPKPTS